MENKLSEKAETNAARVTITESLTAARCRKGYRTLEPYEGKLSRTVLRGGRVGNGPPPLGAQHFQSRGGGGSRRRHRVTFLFRRPPHSDHLFPLV